MTEAPCLAWTAEREPGPSAKLAEGTCGVFDEYALDPG